MKALSIPKAGIEIILVLIPAFLFILSWFCHLPWLASIMYVPVYIVLRKTKSFRSAFSYSLCLGIIYASISFFWVMHFYWLIYVVVVLYQSAFFLLSCLGSWFLLQRTQNKMILITVLPALWVAGEFLRGIGYFGLPIGFTGYVFSDYLSLIQIASITGVFGVSYIILALNVIIFFGFMPAKKMWPLIVTWMLAICCIVAINFYGKHVIASMESEENIKIGIVQGNITQIRKWKEEELLPILDLYARLTKEMVSQELDLVIWPETAIPCFLFHPARAFVLDALKDIVAENNVAILLGTQHFEEKNGKKSVYNEAILIDETGNIQRYKKNKLIPIVEDAPFDFLIPWLRSLHVQAVYKPGKAKKLLYVSEEYSIAPLICFESLFSSLVRSFVELNPSIVVNITNDEVALGNFKAYYRINANMARMRAIENRRSLVRLANNGRTIVFDARGKEILRLPLFKESSAVVDVPVYTERPFYVRFGDIFAVFCLFLTIFGLVLVRK